jgi:hypothetical protein
MSELCNGLSLSIYREADPGESGKEQIRILLSNELEMSELSVCYQINQSEKPHQSHHYYIKEAVVIALRRVVSQAFDQGLITDSLGTWTFSKIDTKESLSTASSTEWEL